MSTFHVYKELDLGMSHELTDAKLYRYIDRAILSIGCLWLMKNKPHTIVTCKEATKQCALQSEGKIQINTKKEMMLHVWWNRKIIAHYELLELN